MPTDQPESDGTLEWDSTTAVVVEAHGGGETGLGYTYCHQSAASVIESKLAEVVRGADALSPPAAFAAMWGAIRQLGHGGVAPMAVSAVDVALWDLKAKLLRLPLADVLPRVHERVPVYGSGGFTSYSIERLREQLEGWVAEGIKRVKMKVGREPAVDSQRVHAARGAVGAGVELMVDANGAYERKQALALAERFAEEDVTWFEEPVTSDDLEGLRLLRDRGPAGMAIAAGEYGWDLPYFREMIRYVDVLQADVTRCGGITGLLRVDGLCTAQTIPFSHHCAPAIAAHACCAMESLVHCEWFHDHVRIERMLFDGAPEPDGGFIVPERTRPGLGLELKRADAAGYAL